MTHAVLAFGRMNPPTTGHEKFIKKTHDVAKKVGGTAHVVASHSEGNSKNPIPQKKKLGYIKKIAHPDVNVSGSSEQHPTILHHAAKLHAAGHTHLHVVAAGDKESTFHKLLHQYNGKKGPHGHYNFKSITVHSSGKRDPDSHDHSEGVSGTSMRQHAHDNNHKEFKKGLPKALHPHKDEIMNHIKTQKESLDQDFETLKETVWKTPHHTDEHDEVHTQAGTPHGTFPDHVHKILNHLKDKDNYHAAMKSGTTTRVSPLHARKLGNTDAGNPKGTRGLEGEKVKRVGSLGKTQTKPIALKDKHTGHMHLLAGNTRLTHSASKGDTTHVHTIHYDSSKMNEEQELPIAGRPGVDSFRKKQEAERRRKMKQQGLKTAIDRRPTNEDLDQGFEDLIEALNVVQRIKRKLIMRRIRPKINRAKRLFKHRKVPEKNLQQRARKAGIKFVRKRVAGKKGTQYTKLSAAAKMHIDKKVSKQQKIVTNIARRLLPRARKAELVRLQRNGLEQDFADYLKERTNATSRQDGKPFERENSPTAAAKTKHKYKDKNEKGVHASSVTEQDLQSLYLKATKGEYPFETILEVFVRGIEDWDGGSNSPAQYAFNRVNSFVAGGKAYEMDSDLIDEAETRGKAYWDAMKAKGAKKAETKKVADFEKKHGVTKLPSGTAKGVEPQTVGTWTRPRKLGAYAKSQHTKPKGYVAVDHAKYGDLGPSGKKSSGGQSKLLMKSDYEPEDNMIEASSKRAADQTSERDRKIGRKSDALRSKQSVSTKSTTLFKRRHGGKTSQHRKGTDATVGRSSSAKTTGSTRRPTGGVKKAHRDLTKYSEKDFRRVHGVSKSAMRQRLANENFSMATGSAGYAQSDTAPAPRVKGKKKKVLEWGTDKATAHAKNMTPGEVNEALPLGHPPGYMDPELIKKSLAKKPQGKTFFQGFNDRKNRGIKSKPIDKDKFFGKKKVEEKLGFDTHTDVVAMTDAASEKPKRKPKREDPLPTFAQLSRIGPDWRQSKNESVEEGLDYKMTYHKHHTSGDGADKKLHKTVTHTSVKFDQKPTTPERVQHVVQNSDVHKHMKKTGYDIDVYGSHKKDHGAFERNHGTKVAYESVEWKAIPKWKTKEPEKEPVKKAKSLGPSFKGLKPRNQLGRVAETIDPGKIPKWNAPDSGIKGMSRQKMIKSMIQQEKDRDARKHDRMMDRARLRDARKKNSEE